MRLGNRIEQIRTVKVYREHWIISVKLTSERFLLVIVITACCFLINFLDKDNIGIFGFKEISYSVNYVLNRLLGISTALCTAVHKEAEVGSISRKTDIVRNGLILLVNKDRLARNIVYLQSLIVLNSVVINHDISDISAYNQNRHKKNNQNDF